MDNVFAVHSESLSTAALPEGRGGLIEHRDKKTGEPPRTTLSSGINSRAHLQPLSCPAYNAMIRYALFGNSAAAGGETEGMKTVTAGQPCCKYVVQDKHVKPR